VSVQLYGAAFTLFIVFCLLYDILFGIFRTNGGI
jgi:hypothetical protein